MLSGRLRETVREATLATPQDVERVIHHFLTIAAEGEEIEYKQLGVRARSRY